MLKPLSIIYCMLACYADTGSKIKWGMQSISTRELSLDFSQISGVRQCLMDQVVVPTAYQSVVWLPPFGDMVSILTCHFRLQSNRLTQPLDLEPILFLKLWIYFRNFPYLYTWNALRILLHWVGWQSYTSYHCELCVQYMFNCEACLAIY